MPMILCLRDCNYSIMISTSFLRTLNLKKYQDFAQENRNRLKVFYIRTIRKINKQKRIQQQISSSENRRQSKDADLQDEKNPVLDNNSALGEENSEYTLSPKRHLKYESQQHGSRTPVSKFNLHSTRYLCERKISNLQKENILTNCKLASLNPPGAPKDARRRPTIRNTPSRINFVSFTEDG